MNHSHIFHTFRSIYLGFVLIISVLASLLAIPMLIHTASAAQLTTISDTIVSSATSTASNHTIVWTGANSVGAFATITVQFSAGNSGGASDEFTLGSYVLATDATISGSVAINEVANEAACSGTASEVWNSTVTNTAGNRATTFTVCPGDTIAAQTITVNFINNHIVNPGTAGSYIIRVTSGGDTADTRVAIVSRVRMFAIVPTSLSFTISGVASTTALLGGQTTSTTTTATAIDYGTLSPGDDQIGAQLLTVSTNAMNGYQVTVEASQALLSTTGADINFFIDDAHTSAPAAWVAPANTVGVDTTYGHFGLSSDDTALSAGNPFSGGTLYVGDFEAVIDGPRQVMYHGSAVNGTGIGVGTTTVWYRVQIGSLQEAGTDYSNTLNYVCTPTF